MGSASGGDCQIVHDGTNTIIHNTTGDLIIRDTAGDIKIQAKSGEESIICNDDGSVDLYHDNTKKFETDANGVTITGTVATLISPNDGQGEIAFGDDGDANIGRIAYNHASNFLATVVNTTEYMRIHSNGVTSYTSRYCSWCCCFCKYSS